MNDARLAEARVVVEAFAIDGPLLEIARYGAGLINDTFRVVTGPFPGPVSRLLQRINPIVFPDGAAVMENMTHVTQHVAKTLKRQGVLDLERRLLSLVPTRSGTPWFQHEDGSAWRVVRFIDGARMHERAESPEHAYRAASAFGRFQALLLEYAGPRLHETIPRFHDTPFRFQQFDQAVTQDRAGRLAEVEPEVAFALEQRPLGGALLALQASGDIPERIAHNDAKIANVLFDTVSGEELCVVDLDTVMPGLSLFDFGDMVRSMANSGNEDGLDPSEARVSLRMFEAITRGYLGSVGPRLCTAEREHLVTAAQVIVLEQGVRFLTDYLNGDVYYRTGRPGQNRDRSRMHLGLLRSLTREQRELERLTR